MRAIGQVAQVKSGTPSQIFNSVKPKYVDLQVQGHKVKGYVISHGDDGGQVKQVKYG